MSKKKAYYAINVVAIISVLAGIFFYENWKAHTLEENLRYTIGKVKGYEGLPRGGTALIYHFSYNGIRYQEKRPIDLSKDRKAQLIGKRFIVKFDSKNPKISSIKLNSLVTDSLLMAPPNGWKDLAYVK